MTAEALTAEALTGSPTSSPAPLTPSIHPPSVSRDGISDIAPPDRVHAQADVHPDGARPFLRPPSRVPGQRRNRESDTNRVHTAGGVDDILLERRVVHVHDELDAERDGLRRPLISPNASPSPARRLLGAPSASASTSDASDDARWRLLSSGAVASAEVDPTAPAWTHLEVMGDATPDSFAQFLVATNGDPRVVDALVAAVVPLGGAVGGAVPTATRVVVGDPSVAAAARDVPGVLWVGPLTPQDVTSRAFDEMLAKSRTSGAPK